MPPTVSVIIPNYNHKPYLQQRLNSVFKQTFRDFEVILLDDASNDNSLAVLNLYKDHPKVSHFIINEINSGSPFKQWQKGIDLAQGQYIWIAESDDYCEPTFLEQLLKNINDKFGICYSQTIDVDQNGETLLNRVDYTKEFDPNIWKSNFQISGFEFIENYLLVKNVIPNTSAVLFRRTLIDDTFFSKKLVEMKMCGDWFFWVRLCEKADISFISEPLNYFRNHSEVSRKHDTVNKKKTRLVEEAKIRCYIYEILNHNDTAKNKKLIEKWFKLHPLLAVFSLGFYEMNLPGINKISLLLKFLSFKLNK